ncbi:MAG: hypothetical protein GEU82_02490 [Luteitalea sp.]|nr:hypothetical protein [Luteitalea sp.]
MAVRPADIAASREVAHPPGAWAETAGASLPEGTRLAWARGAMVELPRGQAPVLSWWAAEPGGGTPLVWADDDDLTWVYFGSQDPRLGAAEALSAVWIRRLMTSPQLATTLSGAFALFVIDKADRTILVIGDRLGIQALHYGRDGSGTWRTGTHLMWLLLASGHDGSVNEDGFLSHVAFGYGVDPHREIYRGVSVVPPSGYLRVGNDRCTADTYWSAPEPSRSSRLADAAPLAAILRSAMHAGIDRAGVFLGLTAGKDSLCLASAIAADGSALQSGTFGVAGCADHVQAAEVSLAQRWSHVAGGVCDEIEFFAWADHIALHSAGLSTASYVDMAAFVATHVPRGSAFVMGEGGECVRDFFGSEGRSPLDTLLNDYMTPVGYLQATLAGRLVGRLGAYPADLLEALRTATGTRDDRDFVSYFYRYQRMPGNFSLRHAVLSPIRPRLTPFLDARFIDATYALSTAEHASSEIHRRIISSAQPSLLKFFSAPVQTNRPTQDWPARFPRLARSLSDALQRLLPSSDDVLDPPGVVALCDAAIAQPSRAVYHLFRLFSFVTARAMLRQQAAERLATIEAECVALSPALPGTLTGPRAAVPSAGERLHPTGEPASSCAVLPD